MHDTRMNRKVYRLFACLFIYLFPLQCIQLIENHRLLDECRLFFLMNFSRVNSFLMNFFGEFFVFFFFFVLRSEASK